ncbi:MAG: hypothetical protein V4772_06135, partial [Pseudomonadota bacterium]
MNPYIWCVVGALLGGLAGLLMNTNDRTIIIENVLVGVFGAYIGGDFVAVMVNGALVNADFSAGSLAYALTGALVSLLLLRLMRRAVG